jgi:predicted pyridoxine 5'-phosphate oxidase superfamily flavin-nucleotide-binding protein
VEDDPELVKRLMPPNYKAKGEQAIMFHVLTWDANCPQHIPQRFDEADVIAAIAVRDQRIGELEAQIYQLTHETDHQ